MPVCGRDSVVNSAKSPKLPPCRKFPTQPGGLTDTEPMFTDMYQPSPRIQLKRSVMLAWPIIRLNGSENCGSISSSTLPTMPREGLSPISRMEQPGIESSSGGTKSSRTEPGW